MTTFSQAVDLIIAETSRQGQKDSAATYLNETLRTLHFTNTPGSPAQPVPLGENRLEDVIIPNVDDAYVWTIPNAPRHQHLAVVYYPQMGKYAHPAKPENMYIDRNALDNEFNYYRSGPSYVFNGFGGIGTEIWLGWFEYVKRLAYYPQGVTRPAEYDPITETWTYSATYNVNPTLQAQARELTSNWILLRWPDLCYAGIRAKLYGRAADDPKAKTYYSAFESMRPGFVAAESYDFIGFFTGGR